MHRHKITRAFIVFREIKYINIQLFLKMVAVLLSALKLVLLSLFSVLLFQEDIKNRDCVAGGFFFCLLCRLKFFHSICHKHKNFIQCNAQKYAIFSNASHSIQSEVFFAARLFEPNIYRIAHMWIHNAENLKLEGKKVLVEASHCEKCESLKILLCVQNFKRDIKLSRFFLSCMCVH